MIISILITDFISITMTTGLKVDRGQRGCAKVSRFNNICDIIDPIDPLNLYKGQSHLL